MAQNNRPFAGGHHRPNCFPPNPNFVPPFNTNFQIPNFSFQNPSFTTPFNPNNQIPNFSIQNPFFQFNHLLNSYLPNPSVPLHSNPSPSPQLTLEKVDSAAAKARDDLVNAGDSVSAWKVSQAVLVQLKVDSWSSLGFHLLDVPSIRHLTVIEGKVNAFIHCFVNSRGITSLYDLELAICKNEGIERFEELGLGPLVRHPLVEHYFSVPSSVTEVFKITSEDIICYLQEYMGKNKRKMIMAQEFLDFIAVQKGVKCKEMLGVRIRSLGLHISHIREARKAETTLRRTSNIIRKNCNMESSSEDCDSPKPLGRLTEKDILDKRFGFISKRVKLFSSSWSGFGAKHIHFDSSDDNNNGDTDAVVDDGVDDDEEDDDFNTCQYQNSSTGKESGHSVSSCPYPSTTEEMARLRLKAGSSKKPSSGNGRIKEKGGQGLSGRKRKFEEKKRTAIYPQKLQGKDRGIDSKLYRMKYKDLILPGGDIAKFVGMWKKACQKHTIFEVVDMMFNFYMPRHNCKRKIKKVLSSFPGIGLLNVAVSAIKYGKLDVCYDTSCNTVEHGYARQSSDPSIDIAAVGQAVEENTVLYANKDVKEPGYGISVDSIIKKITEYLECRHHSPIDGEFVIFKKLCDCEAWLTSQYSVKEFTSFGHGNFCEFLVKHFSLLPVELHNLWRSGIQQRACGDVAMFQKQLSIFVSQAESTVKESGVTKNYISTLLRKQFPTISLHINENEPEIDLIKKYKDDRCVSCVVFSSTLLGENSTRNYEIFCQKSPDSTEYLSNIGHQKSSYGTFSAKDAIDCLLKAPMLSDLLSWSHWDTIYSPSLGSLLEWLLNDVNTKELSCIATIDGKLIRIDPSAIVDEFLEALIHFSSFQSALKLLSLVAVYRGTSSAPMSLLKCYAESAINVIMRNSLEDRNKSWCGILGA